MRAVVNFIFITRKRYPVEAIRVFFYTYLFIEFFSFQETQGYFKLDERYWNPTGFFKFLDVLAPPLSVPFVMEALWKGSLLFCALGFLTKFSKWVALLLTFFFLGYLSNFYLYTANYIVLTYCLGIFTFCDFGRAWSIDSAIFCSRRRPIDEAVESWSLRFVQLAIVGCWLGSGIQKLRISGLSWITVNHFKHYVEGSQFFTSALFFHVAAVLTLFFELISPAAFYPKLRWFILSVMFIFHSMSIIVFKIPLAPWLVSFVFWVNESDFAALKKVLAPRRGHKQC